MDTLTIDVISDVVCPWCFIGKKKLERAIETWRAEHPQAPAPLVRWHPFQLNPTLPQDGMARADYLEAKFGSPQGGPGYDRVRAVGAAVDIPFAFERIERQPNTVLPHSLIAVAGRQGGQNAIVDALFDAYFLRGADLTSADTLRLIASDAGLAPDAVAEALDGNEVAQWVRDADERARESGIQGVPLFIFNSMLAVSGAQDPDVLVNVMNQAVGSGQPVQ